MRPLRTLFWLSTVLFIGMALAYFSKVDRLQTEHPAANVAETHEDPAPGKVLYYRNPMGLADTSPAPKKDSMGMDYIPVYASEVEATPGTVTLSPQRVQKLGVRTALVENRLLTRTLRTTGTTQVDEARQVVVSPRFEGWIERLHVNTTGQKVRKGETLFDVYSPELAQMEGEFLSSIGTPSESSMARRLRTFYVPAEEIERLRREKKINDRLAMPAPMDGTVMEKQAIEGMKFVPGDVLYKIVDLSSLWVIVDVYEQDLAAIALGQTAEITIDAYPGQTFEGKVVFIYPDINKDTRTAKVRIELPNPHDILKTNMYAQVVLTSPQENTHLVIPASALLDNGDRKVVLVDLGEGHFQPRTVKTGVRDNDFVSILDGLSEGERVVTSASFLIDAESNIRSALQNLEPPVLPSTKMSPMEELPTEHMNHGEHQHD